MFQAKENANAKSSMTGTNLVCLKNRKKKKPLWLKHNKGKSGWKGWGEWQRTDHIEVLVLLRGLDLILITGKH